MKITVKLSREEAQKLLGAAISATMGGRYWIEEVSWTSYGNTVEIELTDEKPDQEAETSAI